MNIPTLHELSETLSVVQKKDQRYFKNSEYTGICLQVSDSRWKLFSGRELSKVGDEGITATSVMSLEYDFDAVQIAQELLEDLKEQLK